MPLSLDALPWFTQKSIAEKMEFADFGVFQQSSKTAVSAAERVKTPFLLPKEISELIYFYDKETEKKAYCRIFPEQGHGKGELVFSLTEAPSVRFKRDHATICNPMNEEFCHDLIHFFASSGSTVSRIHFCEENKPEMTLYVKSFNELLIIAKVEEFCVIGGSISTETFRNIPASITKVRCTVPLDDSDLMMTTIEDMDVSGTTITTEGINCFLKEWKEGKRRFKNLVISSFEGFQMYEILKDFQYEVIHSDRLCLKATVENGSQLLEIELRKEPGESCVCIRVKENFEKLESEDEPMEYEEFNDEEDQDYY